tara:strand:- start:131 stop:301 length:171 start_codon:yes stop_codon:yes gene_type:complete
MASIPINVRFRPRTKRSTEQNYRGFSAVRGQPTFSLRMEEEALAAFWDDDKDADIQ